MTDYTALTIIEAFEKIDSSYSVVTEAITLDLPESLNEEKLEYVALTEEQIAEMAAVYYEADYIDKQFDINSDAEADIAKYDAKISTANTELDEKLASLDEECSDKCVEAQTQAIDNGVARSSIYQDCVTVLQLEYEALATTATSDNQSVVDQYYADIAQINIDKQAELDNLDLVRDAEIAAKSLDIAQDDKEEYYDIVDFNNDIERREQEYLYDRAVQYLDAETDEINRAITIAELQLKLGDAGLADLIAQQKFSLAKTAVADMEFSEAMYFLTSAIRSHLGDYYDSFVEYVYAKQST